MTSGQFAKLLQLLAEHDVEAIVVGMLAGVLQGVPLTTGDVDIVHRHLMGPGHHLLESSLGDLDCLGTIDNGKT